MITGSFTGAARACALLAALAACRAELDDALFVGEPVVEMNAYFAAPLVGQLVVTTRRPTTMQVTVRAETASFVVDDAELTTDHRLTLLGFRAGQHHGLEVVVTEEDGVATAWPTPLDVTTDPLPADFPVLRRLRGSSDRVPGVDLFHVDAEPESKPEYIMMLDGRADVVWYFAAQGPVNHVHRLANGNLQYMPDRYWIEEIDLWGRSVRRFKAALAPQLDPGDIAVDTFAFHHDVIELPSGHLLTLGLELVDMPGYPRSEADPTVLAPARVGYDELVEFDAEGTVVNEVRLREVLDPLRVGWESVSGDWWTRFAGIEIKDWGHANSVAFDPGRDRVLVSLRNQDTVASLHWPSGELEWILAPPENWSPTLQPLVLRASGPNTVQQFHQHAAKWVAPEMVMMFDNGNHQASAGTPPVSGSEIDSRAVAYRLDPTAGTFTQIWSWGGLPEPNFSPGLGNVQLLRDADHVLVTYGAVGGDEAFDARVIEVDRGTDEVVYDLALARGEGRIYRAVRIDSPYPDGTPVQ